MTQLTTSQARVVNPILSAIARSVAVQSAPIADVLFPRVSVAQRAGKIITFGREHFQLVSTARAPGANTKREQFGYTSGDFALVDYSLEGLLPIEIAQEAQAVPGISLSSVTIAKVRAKMDLEREKQAADLALTAASYGASNKVTLSGTDQWSDPASDPFGDITAAKEAVRAQIGVRPNVLVLGPKVKSALSNHPDVLARLRGGVGSDGVDRGPASNAELAKVFELERVVEGAGIYHNGTAFVDIWGTYAVLAYTVPGSLADMGTPSYGYTYQLEGYPIAETPYFERNPKSWVFPVTDARAPVLAGASAGFLFTGASA